MVEGEGEERGEEEGKVYMCICLHLSHHRNYRFFEPSFMSFPYVNFNSHLSHEMDV